MALLQAGDRIHIPVLTGSARTGEIVAVCGRDRGQPPYAVRFDGEERVRLVMPGLGTVFDHRRMDELDS